MTLSRFPQLAAREPLLVAVIDAMVPRDASPAASEAGALDFLVRYFRAEGGDETSRLVGLLDLLAATGFVTAPDDERLRILDGMAGDPDYRWFALLVADGYYADEGNGGNRGSVSWQALGYDPTPAEGWPDAREPVRRGIRPGRLAEHYDVIVVGSGAGGGVAACVLAEAGRRVLLVERGEWPEASELWGDHLRNARAELGFDPRTGPPSAGNPRVLESTGLVLWPRNPRWGNNAMTAGGGTRVYGAQAWRFAPRDFEMASTYGVPDGSALSDWPIGYADLEPYYDRAEHELGVSGAAGADPWAGPRSRDYPMPPMPPTLATGVLEAGAHSLGLATGPVPLLVNSVPYGGRSACVRCGACVGFSCPVEAKSGTHNTVIDRAIATGRCDLLLSTVAARLVTDAVGSVVGVELTGHSDGHQWRRDVLSSEVVLGAGAVETARLLLNSPSDAEPDGVGNGTGQVGRHLQGHLYAGALGIFDDIVVDGLGPGPSIATCDYRHGNEEIIGGGMLANEFVPTPSGVFHYLASSGLLPLHGLAAKEGMRRMLPRMQRIVGPVHEMTSSASRVRIDPRLRDARGIPVARLSGGLHPEDLRTQAFLGKRSEEWLLASGAARTVIMGARQADWGPSSGTHQAGTCRMGTDPARSVTDPLGRVWGHANLRIVDASTHVTNSGVNPVLTILANAFRITGHMVSGSA